MYLISFYCKDQHSSKVKHTLRQAPQALIDLWDDSMSRVKKILFEIIIMMKINIDDDWLTKLCIKRPLTRVKDHLFQPMEY